MSSQTSGGAPRSRAGGACEAPPHKDGNRLADQLLSWIYALYPHSRAEGYCDKNKVEEPPYVVLSSLENNVEIREYQSQIWAVTSKGSENGAFGILAGYIFRGK